MLIVLAAGASALVTVAAAPPVIGALQRRAVIDTPGHRSSHSDPTPRGGGLAPALGATGGALIAATATSNLVLVVGAAAMGFGVLGWADDVRDLAARTRLVAQLAIATCVVVPVAAAVGSGAQMLLAPLAVLWLVAFVNAFNFMDGINGISATQTTIAGGAWTLTGLWQDQTLLVASGLIVAVAALAFLPFNFPAARVFLGDVGSYFLGAWLAATALVAVAHDLTPEMAVAPLLLYLADTGTTLVRRGLRGERLTQSHREHTYQRLVIGGWSHTTTTGFAAAVTTAASLLGAATMVGNLAVRAAADLALVLLMAAYLASPRWQQRRRPAGSAPDPRGAR